MDSLAVSNGNFTLDLFKALAQLSPGKNIFFSPWSISTVLAMIYLGARGKTAVQMAEKPDPKDEEVHHKFQELISEIIQPKSTYLLKTANRIYAKKTDPLLSEYKELTKKHYHAEAQEVNFSSAEQARNKINLWVESCTDHKIKDMLPKGAVDSLTVLVLVNAIYFKGNWKSRFNKEHTTTTDFRLSKTTSKSVQMMLLKDVFPAFYISNLKVNILELPYVNDDLSMLILLPDDITDESTGLELLEKELTYERLSTWASPEMMKNTNVEVHLPKIQLAESYDLKTTLRAMGMTDVFSQGQANLTGMSEKNDLYLSQVFHKSYVEVNEEGTVATGATAGVVTVRSKTVEFKADHPFLFFIRHNKSKSILFFGRFCAP